MSPKWIISSLITDEDSEDSINENNSRKIHQMECDGNGDLTLDHIRLLVELFYLSYQNGPNTQQMFSLFYWLRYNYNCEEINQWRSRALLFHNYDKNVSSLL